MSVATIKVPSRSAMASGIGKAILYGIEYEMLPNMQVEITCADDVKLDKLIGIFQGEVVSKVTQKAIRPDLPKHEA